MINIIFTGLIRTPERFIKSVNDYTKLKSENKINQIILSTWIGELDNYNGLRNFLKKKDILIVESLPPFNEKDTYFFQVKSLHLGLDNIKDSNSFIFKTRPDVYLKPEALLSIFNLDLTISSKSKKIFEKKIWVPWFEITKPFYIADECIFGKFDDIFKLINYEKIYDHYFVMDAGHEHVRKYVHPFLTSYPIFKKYLKYLSTTAHNTSYRFEVLDKFMSSENYWQFIYLYYHIIKSYFYVGLENNNFIKFRKWNESKIMLPNDIKKSFQKTYSFDERWGQIYSYTNKWVENIDFANEQEFKLNENNLLELHKFAVKKRASFIYSKKSKIIKNSIIKIIDILINYINYYKFKYFTKFDK